MTLYQDLQNVDLSPNQALVYLTLFRMNQAKAGDIIKKTGLHRNLVYVALRELSEKKLVTNSSLGGVALYKTLSPSRLLAKVDEKQRLARNIVEELSLLKKGIATQEIIVYEGIDEFRRQVKQCFAEMKPGGVTRYLGLSTRWHEIMGSDLEEELIQIQNEKQFRLLALANSITPGYKEYARKTKGLTQCRSSVLIASDTSETEILEDRICIRSFLEPFFVVEIVHKELAKNHQNYFDFLWKNSK